MASFMVNYDGVFRTGLSQISATNFVLTPLIVSDEQWLVVEDRPSFIFVNSDGVFKIVSPYIVNIASVINLSADTTASNIERIQIRYEYFTSNIYSVSSITSTKSIIGSTSYWSYIDCAVSTTSIAEYNYIQYFNIPSVSLITSVVVQRSGSETWYSCNGINSVSSIASQNYIGYIQEETFVGACNSVFNITHNISVLTPIITEITGLLVTSVSEITSDSELINLVGALCYVTMTLIKLDGRPVGEGSYAIVTDEFTGRLTYAEKWRGVQVTAKISLPRVKGRQIITVENVTATTDSRGYAQIPVFQGLDVTISCPSLGSSVTFNTGNNNTLDISNYL